MADDTDLIARVYPYKERSPHFARRAIESNWRCKPPRNPQQQQHQQEPQSSSSRGTTPSPESAPPPEDLDELPYLELRFSDAPRTSSGLLFGTDGDVCDVILPKIQAAHLSRRHFALTYKNNFPDKYSRLIVRDVGSAAGTIVSYNPNKDKVTESRRRRRSGFEWIIDGFSAIDEVETFIVKLHKSLQFQIVVACHDISSPEYANNVERFSKGAAGAQDLLGGLGLESGPATGRCDTGTHTPGKDPILLPMNVIGNGGYGIVRRHWNVSTGEEYACKRPVKALKEHEMRMWDSEINIIKGISHDNIVRLRYARLSPSPRMYLEYMALGSLEDQHRRERFSHRECIAILHQSASALKYLHSLAEPVTHRDLKPENILVHHRDASGDPDGLCIKLADFGLSKIGDSLKTGCGTYVYLPPEICYDGPEQRYTKAVDIWSLGVLILRISYGLPKHGSSAARVGLGWCEKVVRKAQSLKSDGLVDILQRMLVIDAEARCSAAECWYEASQLLVPPSQGRSRGTTPTPASYAESRAASAQPFSMDQGVEEQEILRVLPHEQYLPQDIVRVSGDAPVSDINWLSPSLEDSSHGDLDSLFEIQRFSRSNGPPPSSAILMTPRPARETSSQRNIEDADRNSDASTIILSQEEDGESEDREEGMQDGRADTEQDAAAALLDLARPRLAQQNASIHTPNQTPQLPTSSIQHADGGGETATRYPDGTIAIHQQAEQVGGFGMASSYAAEELPDGQGKAMGRRRKRTSPEDKDFLEAAYQENPRPGRDTRLRVVQRVSMNEKQVQTWFQNRRQADRKGK